MKLHLPKTLRSALFACFASVAGLTSTIATGAMLGGAFYVSLSQVAQAGDVPVTAGATWSNADAATHADDTVTVGDAAKDDAIILQVGNGNTNALNANASIDFGTVTVNAKDTLKLHIWTGTHKDAGATGKVTVNSAITLNEGAELFIEDGSYALSDTVTVNGAAGIRSKWGKGINISSLVGDEHAVLTLSHGVSSDDAQYDGSRAAFELSGDNSGFKGTVQLLDDNGENQNPGVANGVQLILSNTNAMVNAILDFGETEDVVLSLNASNVLLKAIKGHGLVEYYKSDATVGEIELTAADGTFSGTSNVNVNWTITGGKQVLSNASILGTYTVGEDADSAFEGAITLGALVNNSSTGIDVSGMTSLTINNQDAFQGATISLGLLTGLSSGNTFTYGDGWLATYNSVAGTATLSDNSAIYWVDAGGEDDTDNDWASGANWQGGAVPSAADTVRLGADAANKIIAFAADASIGQARVVEGDYVFTTDGNVTLTGNVSVVPTGASLSKVGAGTLTLTSVTANALDVAEGSLIVNSLRLYSGEAFTKTGSGDLTLTDVAANTLDVSAGELAVNSVSLVSGNTFTKTGTGSMTLSHADGLLGKNITVEAGELHITQTGNFAVTNGSATTVTVKSGAALDDDRRLGVTGGSLTVTGGGIYELEGICLSSAGNTKTTLNVEADTVLHITGTTQSATGSEGSFMLSNWGAANDINIRGLLVSNVGISDRDGSGTLNIESGGALQLNDGMSRTNHGNKDTIINIKSGAVLIVNDDAISNTDYITTNLAAGATVFTTKGATILNAMNYNGAVELGAAADTILSLTASSPNVGTITILGTGDTVTTFADDAVSQTAAGGTVKYTHAVSGTAITLNEGAKFEAAAGLNLSGALTLTTHSEAKLSGVVTLDSLANAGTIDVSELQSLRLGADAGSMGASVNLGTVSSYTAGNSFTYGNGWTATWQDDGTAIITADAAVAWSDEAADDNINWNEATNWSSAAVPATTAAVQLTADNAGKTIALTDNTTVQELRVYGAYTLSVASGASYSFTATDGIKLNSESAGLSKAGDGTLAMSLAQAQAAKMHITEGALKLTDEFGYSLTSTVTQSPDGGINYNLTGITATENGVLQVDLNGDWSNQALNATAVALDADFKGTLEVVEGQLLVKYGNEATHGKSDFGGATAICLNQGAIYFQSTTNFTGPDLIIGANGGNIINRTSGTVIASSITGSGSLSVITDNNQRNMTWTGEIDLDGKLTHASTTHTLTIESETKALFDGGITMTGGTININSDADISELSVTGGTFKINGANVGVSTLKSGAITLTGESALTATLADQAQVSLTGANTVDATLSVTAGGTASLLGGLILDTLTVNAGGTLALNGEVSLGSLSNSGLLDISGLTSLSVADMVLTAGSQYNVGALTGLDAVNWNTLLGVDSSMIVSYDGSNTLSIAANAANPVLWVGDADSTWNETDANGASTAWEQGDAAYTPTADSAVLLGNAASLGDRNDSVTRTIGISANTTVGTLTVQDAYNFSVAEGASYSFDAGSIVLEQGGSLGKVGAGTLSMSLADAVAAQMAVTEGTLSISDSGMSRADLSALSVRKGGTVSVSLTGSSNDSTSRGCLTLADSFAGVLEIRQGSLYYSDSTISTNTTLQLNGGGILVATEAGTDEAAWLRVTQNVIVGTNGAHLTTWGQDTVQRTTKLTGDLSGAGELLKRDGGSARLAGTMANYTGSLNVAGGRLYVENTDGDVTLSALKLGGGRLIVDNGAALNATTTATTNGTSYATAESGSTLNLGAVTIAANTKLDVSVAGESEHTITSLTMAGGSEFILSAGKLQITATGNAAVANGTSYTMNIGSGATLTDARRLGLTGGTVTIKGGGMYELEALCMSFKGGQVTTMNLEADTTLHITGTVTSNVGGDGSGDYSTFGSFMLSNWSASNILNVSGLLVSEAGVSNRDGSGTINIKDGGALQMNGGLQSSWHGNSKFVTINVEDGGHLLVNGDATNNANRVPVNLADGATVFTGQGGNIAVAMTYAEGGNVQMGAAKDTTLTLTADTPTVGQLTILGTQDAVHGMVADGSLADIASGGLVKYTKVLSGESITLNDGAQFEAAAGLNLSGALTLGNTSAATLKGEVSLGSLSNSGSIDLAAATGLTLGDFSLTEGATYTVGTLTGLSDTHTIGSLLGAGVGHTVTYDGSRTITVDSHLVWNGAEGNFVWNAENTNWQFDAAESAFREDQKVIFTALDGVNTTVELGEDVTADSILLLGAYNFSVTEGSSYSLAATHGIAKEGNGSFTKVGGGTLIMSNADALAAGVHISAGALQLRDTQANTVNSGSILPDATNTDTWRESGVVVDLSALTANADGTLKLTLAGMVNDGNDSTRLQLSESFAGKVEVLGGQLGHASSLGGATQVILNGGGIVFNNDGDDANNNSTVFAKPVHIASGSTGALRVWGSYSNLAAAVSSLSGDDTATLQKYDDGAIRLDELSGFAGKMEIHKGVLILNDATGSSTLNSLYMVAGTKLVLETGQQLIINSLVEGTHIDMNGASQLSINALNSNGMLDFEGDAAAHASFAVAEGDIFTLAHNGLTLGALTNAGSGTLKLKGAVALGDLYNADGIIDLSDVTSLSISNMQYAIGAEYHVGAFTGKDTDAFLSLIGNGGNSFLSASYDVATGKVSFSAATYWKDDGADGNNVWADATNWSTGDAEGFTLANTTVKLGNEATGRNILLQSNVDATTTVHVAEAYTFSVAADEHYAFNGTLQYANDQVQALTKAGAGTLTVSLEQATANGGMHIEEGRLVVLGDVTTADGKNEVGGYQNFNMPYDMTALSSSTNGILSVSLYGNVSNVAFDGSALKLADDFTGALEVTHGYVYVGGSSLGGTGKILLNGGGVALYDDDTLDVDVQINSKGGWFMGRQDGNEYSGSVTGAGNMTIVSNYDGDVLTFSGSITLEDYITGQDENGADITAHSDLVKRGGSVLYITGADNNINISGGVIAEAGRMVFQNQQKLNGLTVSGNSQVILEKNADIGNLTVNNGELIIGTDTTGAEVSFSSTDARVGNSSTTRKVTLKSGSAVTDAAYWQLTGGSLTLAGEGSYTIAGIGMTATGASATTLNIEHGISMHVSGTANDAGKNTGAFSLGHWNNQNTVNVRGVLELESGISTYSGYTSQAAINVEEGGKLAFNNGLTAVGKDNAVTINVLGGATLQVSGTQTTGTNLVNVNIGREATVMGGNANGATETIIANDLLVDQGFYAGAVAGTTLYLAPESGSLDADCTWIDVLGTADGAGGTVVFDVDSLQLNALNVHAGGKAVINGDADLQDANGYGAVVADGTLSFDGAGIITLNEAIQLGAGGTVEFLNTADTKLVLSDALLTEDNPGLSMTWTLIDTTAGGTLLGWDKGNLDYHHFLLDGAELSLADWDGYTLDNGKLTLHMLVRYWDATTEGAIWNTTDSNWRPTASSADTNLFETNSRVIFTDTDDAGTALQKAVTADGAGVHAKSIVISGSDYVFSGGNVLVDQSISATQDARFDSALVIGSSAQELNISVGTDATLTVGVLETLSDVKNGVSVYLQGGGSFRKSGEGILRITDGVQGIINNAVVESGSLQLDSVASLTVGSNTITGGNLQNVGIYAEGSVIDFTSGEAVITTNVIASADGVNMAVLTGVNLNAGSASAYASIQKVAFAGESTLSGYITFEETKHQREMAVATGGTLTVQDLIFDLHGLSTGTKVLIENGAVADAADAYKGSINGWDSITLTYSGVAVNADSVDTSVAGVVTIKEDGGDLYWDGLSAGAAAANWNTTSANWSSAAGTDGTSIYLALSDTYFGATPEGAARDINVAQDMVANRIYITQGGYSFAGYRVATLSDMVINTADAGAITFDNELVVQGALTATVAGELNLVGTTTVVGAANITAKVLNVTGDTAVYGDLSISSGSTAAGEAGSFTMVTGVSLSAANISLHVDAGAASDTDYTSSKVTSNGDISTTGALSITGNAAKDFNGVVRADTITVDTGDRSNAVSFNSVSAVTMKVTGDSTVNLETAGPSGIGSIQLAGTLGYTTFAGDYSGYNVVTTSADANVSFASITKVTLSSLSGDVIGTDAEGNDIYGSISFGDGYRSLTINKLSHVQNLHIGQAEYGATLNNATGAIHGNLSVASGAGLTVNSDNIMANAQGAWELSGPLKLGNTTQTLAGNTLYLSGALISGNAAATGLAYTENATMNYTAINTISANMNVAEGKILTIASGKTNMDSVEISGNVSGSGSIILTGHGTVVLAGANDYTGDVTVEGLVSLKVANTQALSHATLNLEADGLLMADVATLGAPAEIGVLNLVASGPVTLEAETRTAGILQLHSLVATEVASAADAAFMVGEMRVSNAQTLDLLLSFEEGESLQTMKTYNLFTADASYSLAEIAESLNLELYVAFGSDQEHVARNQYKVIYDAASNVISIRTMFGNIWSGGADLAGDGLVGDGIWSTDNTDLNWSNKDYSEASGFNSAIFVDLESHDGQLADVTIQGTVTPGDIYFEADSTYYNLVASEDGAKLAAGTDIHKAGSSMVYLALANNGTMENSIGNVDLQAGTITLSKSLAVSGEVQVSADAQLRAFAYNNSLLVTNGYTAAGVFSGVTMGQDAISGITDAEGNVTKGSIASQDIYTQVAIVGKADAPVLLENVTLASYGTKDTLTNVAIGQNVDVTGYYTLNGHVHFNDTLLNSGTVTLQSDMTAEIGKLAYTFTVDANGASQYVYQLVQGGQINGMGDLTVQDLYINGVNLSVGLADGVATVYTGNDGSLTLSIGNVTARDENGNVTAVDGTVGMPKWDERWNNGNQPGLSRRYADTDAAAVVTFAEGVTSDTDYYYYSSVVNESNANAVNGSTHEVVVTLSAASVGAIAAGGATAGDADMEMWLYDRSGFDTVIAGRYAEGPSDFTQKGDTHLLINTDARHTNLKTWVVGGSWNVEQTANSHVTVQVGNILTLVGGTYGAAQEGASTVYIDGGCVYEAFAGGYNGSVASSTLTITGGTLGGQTPEGTRSDLAGTKSIYGGSYNGMVLGDVIVTVDGDATITNLVGGGYAGTVEGNITLNLLNGAATTVNAAGMGNATARGDVLVNLYDAFNITELYGGKQGGSGATVQGSSTLAFVEEGVSYDMSGKKIQGFDTISLADGTVVNVSTADGFATDSSTGLLTISGAGMLNLTGDSDIARDITLVNGATLWFNSDYAGNPIAGEGNDRTRRVLTATAGTTIDITGQPKGGDGLCVWLDLTGHGVDDKGALYKGLQDAETSPSGKVALSRVTLSDSASVNAEDNIYFIDYKNEESEIYLNAHTLTKIGDKDLVLYNSTVKDNTNANAVVDGTIFVKEGTLGTGHGMRAAKTNVVLAEGSSLDVLEVGGNDVSTIIGALSGSGATNLARVLTITTDHNGSYGTGSDFMDTTEKYNQFSSEAGFSYGVYSGAMSGAGALNVTGDGTQYLAGSESSYTGGTHLYDSATLYLMGSTEGSATKGNSSATGGVLGTGFIAWESADATLYLGNGVQIFNNGTTNVSGSTMVIGVEAAPKGDKLTNYVGANSLGANGTLTYITLDGVEYVEVATHNLSSISCNGKYADGTAYMAGTLIDRNKMLLVSRAVWEADTATVSGFSEGGYNTATYSGVLQGMANLEKVGLGTLILDQMNTYTGSTTISEGSLVLKGWAQIGGSKTSAALNVEQKVGSSLMLAYDGTYGDEITGISNDISINGTGDVRWTTETATGNDTAALISTIGSGVNFTLSGDISGDGNLLHAGAGTLVLSGDSTYTGGTHATTGVVEVQSSKGLGNGKVVVDATADLHATVEAGTTASRLTTAISATGSSIKGDVVINGTADTERVLSMNTAGYESASTTLNDTGTFLVNGAAVQANTKLLKGTGTLAVSDATGQGATAQADALMDFSGDFVVEGDNASIAAKQGNFNGGSMSISGQNAKVTLAGTANIAYGERLDMRSTGQAAAMNNTAATLEASAVSLASGATLSVSNERTSYDYNLSGLQAAASTAVGEMLSTVGAGANITIDDNGTHTSVAANGEYTYHFDADRALNGQAAGMISGGLTLNGGSRYEEHHANISLAGGTLTLDTSGGKIALDLLTPGNVMTYDDGFTSQMVLFTNVSSFTLDGTAYGEANAIMMMAAADGELAAGANTIYSTLASNYFTGWNITNETYLVYDVGAGVVYLDKAVPEPTTTTLSLLALAALVARRRRK